MNRLSYYHILPSLLFLLWILIPTSLSAGKEYDLDWKWRSNPIHNGSTTVEIEYDFKNDSVLLVTFNLVESLPDGGTYEANVIVEGQYALADNMMNVYLNRESASVNNEKLTYKKGSKDSKGSKTSKANTVIDPSEVWRKTEEKKHSTIDKTLADYGRGAIPILNRKDNGFTMLYDTRSNTGNDILRGEFIKLKEGGFTEHSPHLKVHKTGYYVTSDAIAKEQAKTKEFTYIQFFGKTWNKHVVLLIWVVIFSVYFIFFRFWLKHLTKVNNGSLNEKKVKQSIHNAKRSEVISFWSKLFLGLLGAAITIWGIIFLISNYENFLAGIAVLFLALAALNFGEFIIHIRMNLKYIDIDRFKEKIRKEHNSGKGGKDKGYILYLKSYDMEELFLSYTLDKLKNQIDRTRPEGTFLNTQKCLIKDERLIQAWNVFFPVFTIGSPSNWKAPKGATRVMLEKENDQWKQDVLYMMENAKYIVINVQPYEIGTYLIELADKLFPEKTAYYIDYVEKITILKEKMGDRLPKCIADYCTQHPEIPQTLKDIEALIEKVNIGNTSTLTPMFIYACMYMVDGKSQFSRISSYREDLLDSAADVIHGKLENGATDGQGKNPRFPFEFLSPT